MKALKRDTEVLRVFRLIFHLAGIHCLPLKSNVLTYSIATVLCRGFVQVWSLGREAKCAVGPFRLQLTESMTCSCNFSNLSRLSTYDLHDRCYTEVSACTNHRTVSEQVLLMLQQHLLECSQALMLGWTLFCTPRPDSYHLEPSLKCF